MHYKTAAAIRKIANRIAGEYLEKVAADSRYDFGPAGDAAAAAWERFPSLRPFIRKSKIFNDIARKTPNSVLDNPKYFGMMYPGEIHTPIRYSGDGSLLEPIRKAYLQRLSAKPLPKKSPVEPGSAKWYQPEHLVNGVRMFLGGKNSNADIE